MIFQQDKTVVYAAVQVCRKEDCIPDGIAVLAGLAVQETQLLERLAENVFAAHFVLEGVQRVCLDGGREYVRTRNK